jgi:hypothetical protein
MAQNQVERRKMIFTLGSHFSAQWINLGAGAYAARLDISTYTSGINLRSIPIQCGFVSMKGAAPKNPCRVSVSCGSRGVVVT